MFARFRNYAYLCKRNQKWFSCEVVSMVGAKEEIQESSDFSILLAPFALTTLADGAFVLSQR